jgi:hypothetical protein
MPRSKKKKENRYKTRLLVRRVFILTKGLQSPIISYSLTTQTNEKEQKMPESMNEKPFEHPCRHGSVFRAKRCDFVGGVSVDIPKGLSVEQIIADAVEMGAFHTAHIWPKLNGFAGHGDIQFILEEKTGREKRESILELD